MRGGLPTPSSLQVVCVAVDEIERDGVGVHSCETGQTNEVLVYSEGGVDVIGSILRS